MDISFVIPSYDMAGPLERSLVFLEREAPPGQSSAEVVVVDDGSRDGTAEVLARFEGRLQLRTVHRARDAQSSRARARNLGIEASRGRVLTFLDAGVLPAPGFQARALGLAADERTVVVHRVLGLYASEVRSREVAALTPEGLAHTSLAEDPEWSDIRDPLFRLVEDDLTRLPAPWALAWTCGLTVPRSLAVQVSGFDEDFLGWGAEDCDFAYRAYRAGAALIADSRSILLHTPHARVGSAEKQRQHLANRRKLHAKSPCRESELYVLLESIRSNLFARRLDELVSDYAFPPCAPAAVRALLAALRVPATADVLLFGVSEPAAGRAWPGADLVVVQPHAALRLRRELPVARVQVAMGTAFARAAGSYQVAIVTDLIRLLPRSLQEAILCEMTRVARSVVLLLSTDDGSYMAGLRRRYREGCGWGWSSPDDLVELVRRQGASVTRLPLSGVAAWQIAPAPAPGHAGTDASQEPHAEPGQGRPLEVRDPAA